MVQQDNDEKWENDFKTDGAPIESKSDKVRIHFLIKRVFIAGMEDIATEEDVSVSEVARRAIREYIRKYKSQTKR